MKTFPVFDGHNDSITKILIEGDRDFLTRSQAGHIDLPRMHDGAMVGGFFAIFAPAESERERQNDYGFHINNFGYHIDLPKPVGFEYASRFVNDTLSLIEKTVASSDGKLAVVRHANEIHSNMERNAVSLLLALEGAEAISGSLDELQTYYDSGIRSIGPFWSRPNIFGTGVQFKFPSTPDIGEGLTDRGFELVRACNRLGIIVDCAHANLKGFWDIARTTTKPIVVTHADVHAICPSSRNVTDDQIKAVAESNGVIGINFEPITVLHDGFHLKDEPFEKTLADLEKMPIARIVDHIRYIAELVGVEYVSFGSDFDGAMMPQDLKDVSYMQNLIAALAESGFSEHEIELIAWKNWVRVIELSIT